jgi:uncharacterized membrane protein
MIDRSSARLGVRPDKEEEEEDMKHLSTTVAVYDDVDAAHADWDTIETASKEGSVDLADIALVVRNENGVNAIKRQSHHGWGKGTVAGAVVGILFPPAILSSAVVGAAAGGVIARLNRSLDRSDIMELGEVMDSGELVLVFVTSQDTAAVAVDLLQGAKRSVTKESSTAEEVMEALSAET